MEIPCNRIDLSPVFSFLARELPGWGFDEYEPPTLVVLSDYWFDIFATGIGLASVNDAGKVKAAYQPRHNMILFRWSLSGPFGLEVLMHEIGHWHHTKEGLYATPKDKVKAEAYADHFADLILQNLEAIGIETLSQLFEASAKENPND